MKYELRIVVEKVAISSQEVIKRDTITSYTIPTTLLKKYLVKAPFPVREIGTVLTLLHAGHVP
jgi:hypothetical protein